MLKKSTSDKRLFIYIWLDPPHVLIEEKHKNKLATVIHELIHHLDSQKYSTLTLNHSTKGYINAKKRVIRWCKKNISEKANWNLGLKAQHCDKEMKQFQL